MTGPEWHAYIAGFFDGEGSVTIARQRVDGKSDYHLVRLTIGQRAKHRIVLDRIAETFGGRVTVRSQKTRLSERWAEHAEWVVQDKPGILRFLQAIQPYCIVKAAQVALGIEFLDTFAGGGTFRDSLGRIRGKMLTADEVERRERLRLAMRDLNAMGPPKTPPSQLPPLDVQHRRRAEAEYVGNPATIKRGETRWNARLTEETVRAIRAEYAAGTAFQQELADRYNVSLMAINKVLTGKTWKHVT